MSHGPELAQSFEAGTDTENDIAISGKYLAYHNFCLAFYFNDELLTVLWAVDFGPRDDVITCEPL